MFRYAEHKKYINAFIDAFIKRCRSSFKDRCSRVGRDVLRKLQNGERVIGAIQMAAEQGIPTDGLEFGAACAILNSERNMNPEDKESRMVRELFAKNRSVADVLCYQGEYNKGTYHGLNREADRELLFRIQEQYDLLEKQVPALFDGERHQEK